MSQREFREKALAALVSLESAEFSRTVLFDSDDYLFATQPKRRREFFDEAAASLEVEGSRLILVGSAKLGFSLNPGHLLRSFSRDSDLDLVVLDEEKFDACWIEMLDLEDEFKLVGDAEKRKHQKTLENIQRGFIRDDQLPLSSSLAKAWFPKFAGPFTSPALANHDLRGWLFRTKAHAISFYARQIARCRGDINKMLSRS